MKNKGTPTLLTEKILKLMKANNGDWQMPWRNKKFITCKGHYLKGNNVVSLAALSDFKRTVWGTYDQWELLGCQVQAKSKAVKLTVYKGLDKDGKHSFGKYIAFNIEQCEGDTAKFDGFDKVDINNSSKCKETDYLVGKLNAVIKIHPNKAAYNPSLDEIYMPDFKQFESSTHYYSTLLHEQGHRTGHKSRLDRELKGKFGDKKYAMEELIAELTSCFMCIELNIVSEPRKDHIQYLNNWIDLLKDDKRAFNMAVGQAQRATNYMLEQMGLESREVNNG